GGVRLRARVRLDVRVLGPEQRLRAVDRELLDHVDVLAAAVVALAGIALGVLVREHAALGLQDRLRHEVLGRDHLERALLALDLVTDRVGDLRVDVGQRAIEEVGGELGHDPRTVATDRASTTPVRGSVQVPSASYARRSITVDGVPGSSPPSSTRSAPSRMPAGTSASRRASAPPDRFAELCRTGTDTPRSSGTSGTRSPSVAGSGPHASGQRP